MIAAALLLASMQTVDPYAGAAAVSYDQRIRLVPYQANSVTDLAVSTGFAAVVEFESDEAVETVVVGDSEGWLVTPTRQGNRLVIKPQGGGATNLTVFTNLRRYVLLLQPGGGQDTLILRYTYPRPNTATAAATGSANYRMSGAKAITPTLVTDDGQRTRIVWSSDAAMPAVFLVDNNGREALVNGRVEGGAYLVEGVGKRLVFRLGQATAYATRRIARSSK